MAASRHTDLISDRNSLKGRQASSPINHDAHHAIIQSPNELQSEETLQALGLSEVTAQNIYQAWIRHDYEDFADFCSFAKDWLEVRAIDVDVGDAESDWVPALKRIGANDVLIAAHH